MVRNKSGEKSIAIQVPEELHKKVRIKAIELDMTLKDYLIQLMADATGWKDEE